jgi:ribosome-associated protein
VGKLMRKLDDETLEAARSALATQQKGSAAETLALHEAERWRDALIDRDEAVTDWLARFPETDSQQLRALVRQARKDRPGPDADAISRGLAPRQGRAYREVFQLVRAQLGQDEPAPSQEPQDD